MKHSLPINRIAATMSVALLASAGASAAVPVKAFKVPTNCDRPSKVAPTVNHTVKGDTIMNENFSAWTAGSQAQPSSEMVEDSMAPQLMSYPGDWTFFRMYEAGGAGFMGFDNIGGDGPGYIKTPGIDIRDNDGQTGYYRYTCRVKNVNADVQDQLLQTFIMDEANSQIISASSKPMTYDEWTECQWVGSSSTSSMSFMSFGWMGNVLIDRLVVEKLIFPLATPKVISADLNDDGTVTLKWDKVEGAKSYSISVEVTFGDEPVAEMEVGDVDTCVIDINGAHFDQNFSFYVTAHNGEEISYPGFLLEALYPDEVATPEALPASNVSADGFTANWQASAFASDYLVLPRQQHTATEPETFYILNEDFRNVPEDADEFNAIQIAPLMGYDGMDLYFSRAGWYSDMAMMVRFEELGGLPIFAISDQYAMMGLPGQLVSPVTDFSVGGGKVTVSGIGQSAADDVVMALQLMDASGEIYAEQEFEFTPRTNMFNVSVEGGRPDSRLVIKMIESQEGGDVALFISLDVTVDLLAGETVTVPAPTVHADGRVTSADVKCEVNENNIYSYAVMGYNTASLVSQPSEYVDVNKGSAVMTLAGKDAKAFISGGILNIVNPSAAKCDIFTLEGKHVATSSAKNISLAVEKGIYIVKVGNKSFKLAY